jgi:hypothetical protein
MTFTDIIAAVLIMAFFLAGLSQAVFPAWTAWNRISGEYQTARSIAFVAASFRKECARTDRNIETWKRAVSIVRELESCEITEYRQEDILRALKASCVISGETVEIIGLCTP